MRALRTTLWIKKVQLRLRRFSASLRKKILNCYQKVTLSVLIFSQRPHIFSVISVTLWFYLRNRKQMQERQ